MRYRIIELLGTGGMGQVYRAWDEVLEREVAVKRLRGADDETVECMLREARAQAKVIHENVCQVYDTGEEDGKPYIAMQLVQGRSLSELASELDQEDLLTIMVKVAEAVQAAHGYGLIHRDLKPGNVMVEQTDDGRWRPFVVDFGLAVEAKEEVLTATQDVRGTPAYMAPEQVRADRRRQDRRVDVYALGAMLYELVSGRRPFEGTSKVDVLLKVLNEQAPPLGRIVPGVKRDLIVIINKCLEKEPEHRYGSARMLAEDLERFLAGEPVLARPHSVVYRLSRFVARHRVMSTTLLVALLLGVTGAVKYTVDLHHEREVAIVEREKAEAAQAESDQVVELLVGLFALSDPVAVGGEISASELLNRGAARVRTELDDQPLLQARLFNVLGDVFFNLARYDIAGELQGEAVALRREHLGGSSPLLAQSLIKRAKVSRANGDFEGAEQMFREARSVLAPGDKQPTVMASVLLGLGMLARQDNRLPEAEALLLEALELRERALGPDDRLVAEVFNSLAALAWSRGHDEDSERYYLRAIKILEVAVGPEHARVATVVQNLASVYLRQKRFEESGLLFERALEIAERQWGPEHPNVGRILNNLGAVCWYTDRADEARLYQERALAIKENNLGPSHPSVAVTLGNLALQAIETGDFERAEALSRRALAIREEVYGSDHPNTAYAMVGLASALGELGRPKEAEALFLRGIKVQATALEPDHPDRKESIERYAAFLRRQNRNAEADRLEAAAGD